jgi:hypothetical protein
MSALIALIVIMLIAHLQFGQGSGARSEDGERPRPRRYAG